MFQEYKNQKFDIILQAGQLPNPISGPNFSEYKYAKNSNVLEMNSDFSINTACEYLPDALSNESWQISVPNSDKPKGDYAFSFATKYIEEGCLEEDRKILILRTAMPATGFLDGRWTLNGDLFLQMIKMLKFVIDLNHENRLATILWLQGETDAVLGGNAFNYYQYMADFYKALANMFDFIVDTPFIAGSMCYQRNGRATDLRLSPILKALQNFTGDIKNGGYAVTDQFKFREFYDYEIDNYYPYDGIFGVGISFFEAFKYASQKADFVRRNLSVSEQYKKDFQNRLLISVNNFFDSLANRYSDRRTEFETMYKWNVNEYGDDLWEAITVDNNDKTLFARVQISHLESKIEVPNIFLLDYMKYQNVGKTFIKLLFEFSQKVNYKLVITDIGNRDFYQQLVSRGAYVPVECDDKLFITKTTRLGI